MDSETDRLEQITREIHGILEERLTAILGDVEAVREIAGIIKDTDVELTRRELLKDQLLARLDGARVDEAGDLRRRIAAHDEAIANLTQLRTDLTNTLLAVAEELRSGGPS